MTTAYWQATCTTNTTPSETHHTDQCLVNRSLELTNTVFMWKKKVKLFKMKNRIKMDRIIFYDC